MKAKYFFSLIIFISLYTKAQINDLFIMKKNSTGFELTVKGASHLASLPLKCIGQEFPNKTSHTSNKDSDHVLLPRQLHPAFFGCFDWHSNRKPTPLAHELGLGKISSSSNGTLD